MEDGIENRGESSPNP